GARELFLPFPGWTLPGVFGAGALQALVKQGLPVRGQRVVVAGTGPLLLAVAALLRSEGAVVPIIFEQARPAALRPFAWAVVRSPSKLLAGIVLRGRLLGVRYATDSYPVRVTSCPSGLHVEYRAGRRTEAIDCDYLACGFGLIPNTELPQLLGCRTTAEGFVQVDGRLATTVPHVYALGELTGIGGVDKALIEGCLAAHAAAGDEPAAARLACDHAAAQGFTRRLAAAFTLRPELRKLAQPDTIICRCEDVPLSAIEHSLSGRDAKLQTRCGMGPCQGRVCGPILQQLLGAEPPQIRPPLFPTAVGTLAAMFPTATS
ncbi:MAG: NAD(P)/FAD-dependent oxidoreductase, partial [Planctomycetes bacterium]|nr:NAD(P)/FAD-dependent oxidoreductase [Planctomycetota bacterium]